MSQPKRRMNGQTAPSPTTQSPANLFQTTTQPISSPSLSTTPRFLLLGIYPAILLIGSLFSLLEPSARSTPYSTLTQSHPADLAPSYFARKSNIFNQYFVKILWLWISGSFALFLVLHPLTIPQQVGSSSSSTGTHAGLTISRRRLQAVLRYVLVTLLWVFTTQWFFGAPLIDRGFRLSGGACEIVASGALSDEPVREIVTAAACKIGGGRWVGGHDISGHVFILILGSAFLALEVWPVLDVLASRGWDAVEERRREKEMEEQGQRTGVMVLGRDGDEREWGLGMSLVAGVVGTALWMLLMTATYFHTWFEKFTGLLVAFAGIGLVYVLPHYVPAVELIVGRPGK